MLKNAIEEMFVILASGKRHKFSSDVFMVDLRNNKNLKRLLGRY